jgi:c-di-GMP-binding flagellar brake protein YcgR
MGDAAHIQGEKITELFAHLITQKTIISLNVVGAGYDRLTCITDLKKDSKTGYLIIDTPDGFAEAVAEKGSWRLRFNFNGPDRLEYIFSTRGGTFCKEGLKIPFPDSIERLQRRLDFRVDTLSGTRLQFKLKKIRGAIDLINVSLGGAYGILSKYNFKFIRGPILKKDQLIHDFSIVFPAIDDKPQRTVHVNRASIRRVEHHRESGFYHYALEFREMENEEKTLLTQIIYDLQRLYLRRR